MLRIAKNRLKPNYKIKEIFLRLNKCLPITLCTFLSIQSQTLFQNEIGINTCETLRGYTVVT